MDDINQYGLRFNVDVDGLEAESDTATCEKVNDTTLDCLMNQTFSEGDTGYMEVVFFTNVGGTFDVNYYPISGRDSNPTKRVIYNRSSQGSFPLTLTPRGTTVPGGTDPIPGGIGTDSHSEGGSGSLGFWMLTPMLLLGLRRKKRD